ncbi:TPA: restriction endonuclease subunit S [Streptococcus suis]
MTRMKDSGIEWIGEVPEDWGLKPIKYLATYDDSILSQSEINQNITINYVDIGSVNLIEGITNSERFNTLEAPSRARRKTQVGDTIVSTVRTYLKAIAYISNEQNYIVSTGFCVLRPSCIDSRFFSYAVKSDSFTKLVEKYAWGVSYPAISSSQLVNLPIAFPKSLPEQTQIADFLDKKVAQLDKVKSLLEEQIKTLEDYRQSLIYETVTKGLDKTVPLKDSGVDWIGQIPEGWGVKSFKYAVTIKDGTHDTPEYFVEGVPLITSKNLDSIHNEIDFEGAKNISFDDHRKISQRSDVKKGDILMPMIGTVGGATQVLVEKEFSIKNVALFKVAHDEALSRFLYYQLNSSWINSQLNFMMSGGVQSFVSLNMLSQIKLVIPTSEEIKKTNLFLDLSVGKINQMIAIKKEQIENINKQRQTLIYDYVTGKRRV